MFIEFSLFDRKYRQGKFDELAKGLYPDDDPDDLDDAQIQDVVNRMNQEDVHVYKIEYCNFIFDIIDDFIKDLYDDIDRERLYLKINNDILESDMSKDEKITALEQLDVDKDNYHLMCLRNDIPFYMTNHEELPDVDVNEVIGVKIMLSFGSVQNDYDEFYVDFMMTSNNNDVTYKKFYQWDDDKDEPLP